MERQMQPKPPDVAWKLIAFTGYYLLLIGIVYLLIPQLLSSRTLEYLSMDGRMQMLMLHRYGGIALIAASLAIVAIASNSLRRGERWAWWTLLAMGALVWGVTLVLHLTSLADIYLVQILVDLVGTVPFAVGILLSLRSVTGKAGDLS
jgi:hypothetical protein